MISIQEVLISTASGVALWIFRKLAASLKRIADDFDEIKKLPTKLEQLTEQFNHRMELTERRQDAHNEQIKILFEKLIEQGPNK
jgi:hypothetical protein